MSEEFVSLDNNKDIVLANLAKKRIRIKRDLYSHIGAYIIINGVFCLVYLLNNNFKISFDPVPGFIWTIIWWGLGLAFHIFHTIMDLRYKYSNNVLEMEIEKLKNKSK